MYPNSQSNDLRNRCREVQGIRECALRRYRARRHRRGRGIDSGIPGLAGWGLSEFSLIKNLEVVFFERSGAEDWYDDVLRVTTFT
jgi:hypothetical protein